MHNKKKERLEKDFMEGVLSTAEEVFIAFNSEIAPYVIAFNFAYENDVIYLHCAKVGRKLNLIKENSNVGFSAICDVEIVRERSTTKYKSVCGAGIAKLIDDPKLKQKALDMLAIRYRSSCQVPASQSMLDRTAVITIQVTEIYGKESLGE